MHYWNQSTVFSQQNKSHEVLVETPGLSNVNLSPPPKGRPPIKSQIIFSRCLKERALYTWLAREIPNDYYISKECIVKTDSHVIRIVSKSLIRFEFNFKV